MPPIARNAPTKAATNSDTDKRSDRLRPAVALYVIFLIALAVRIAWSSWADTVPATASDAEYYEAAALSLARGQGYTVDFSGTQFLPGGEATAFWPPGFSAFLAVNYRVFGEDLGTARTANVFVGALTVIPVFFIGRRLFGSTADLVGAAIVALLPSFVFWTPVLLSETFFTFLFASTVAVLLYALHSDRTLRPVPVVVAGLLVGFAAFVRGQALVLPVGALLWWLLAGVRPRTAMLSGLAMLAAAAIVLAPWSLRNARVMDSPALLSTNFGYNLRVGHAGYSTGRYMLPRDLWDAQPGITFHERETVFNDLGLRRAVSYAAHNPLCEVSLSVRKVAWLWRPDSDAITWATSFGQTPLPSGASNALRITLSTAYFAILALAAATLYLFRTRRNAWLLPVLFFVLWTAAHVVFFGEPRYHLPMLALLVPMAAASLVWIAEILRRRLHLL
jgi:4-amino-4-deoxy-L-arabinose transferase-like glycosyltransferase